MTHSKVLEDTKLWQVYAEKAKDNLTRMEWTQKVCYMACEHLKAVRDWTLSEIILENLKAD